MRKRKDECLMCHRRKCYTRIVNKDLSFDELACSIHNHDLLMFAQRALGHPKNYYINFMREGKQRRGLCSDSFLRWADQGDPTKHG